MMHKRLALFSAYTKLPQQTTASVMFKVAAVVVLINVETGKIVEAEATLSTELSKRVFAQAVVGQSFEQGPEAVLQRIRGCYQGSARNALLTAIRVVYDKYRAYLEQEKSGGESFDDH